MYRSKPIRFAAHIFRIAFPLSVVFGTYLFIDNWGFVKMAAFGAASLLVYGYPLNTAHERQQVNWKKIAIVNVLFGWTIVGWIVALVWAFRSPSSGAETGARSKPGFLTFTLTQFFLVRSISPTDISSISTQIEPVNLPRRNWSSK